MPAAQPKRRRAPLWLAVPAALALAWVLRGLWFHWDADPAAISNAELLLGWDSSRRCLCSSSGAHAAPDDRGDRRHRALSRGHLHAPSLRAISHRLPSRSPAHRSCRLSRERARPAGSLQRSAPRAFPSRPRRRAPGLQCQRVVVRDSRRSLLGVQTRRFSATVLGCWEARWRARLVQLLADVRPTFVPASTRIVRLGEWAPLTSGALVPGEPTSPENPAGVGSFMRAEACPTIPSWSATTERCRDGPVQITSSRDGARLRLVAAWLSSGAGRPVAGEPDGGFRPRRDARSLGPSA